MQLFETSPGDVGWDVFTLIYRCGGQCSAVQCSAVQSRTTHQYRSILSPAPPTRAAHSSVPLHPQCCSTLGAAPRGDVPHGLLAPRVVSNADVRAILMVLLLAFKRPHLSAMKQYLKIFNFLWRAKRMEFILSQVCLFLTSFRTYMNPSRCFVSCC